VLLQLVEVHGTQVAIRLPLLEDVIGNRDYQDLSKQAR
jgi:hypothetical protein